MVQKNKICKVIICLVAILAIAFIIYNHEVHQFKHEKWILYPDRRYLIVEDLLSSYNLVGMSEDDVISLLGEESKGSQQSSFKGDRTYYDPEETLVYYIGTDILEGQWLILPFENEKVARISFGVT